MMARLKWQVLLAAFWFVSAYLAAGAVFPWTWAWGCALLNMVIGLVGMLIVTRTDQGDRIFYQGPREDEPGLWQVACLWTIPVLGLFVAAFWWLLRLIGIFDW